VTRNIQLLTVVGAFSLLLVGCGSTAGFLRDSITQVQVQRGDFRIVKTGLAASADTGKVFCMIPVDDGQAYRHAMEGLHAATRLGPNQMLVNIREDWKAITYLGFYCAFTLTVSADVIEFGGGGVPAGAPPAAQ
jgi:hypothetical protein